MCKRTPAVTCQCVKMPGRWSTGSASRCRSLSLSVLVVLGLLKRQPGERQGWESNGTRHTPKDTPFNHVLVQVTNCFLNRVFVDIGAEAQKHRSEECYYELQPVNVFRSETAAFAHPTVNSFG